MISEVSSNSRLYDSMIPRHENQTSASLRPQNKSVSIISKNMKKEKIVDSNGHIWHFSSKNAL